MYSPYSTAMTPVEVDRPPALTPPDSWMASVGQSPMSRPDLPRVRTQGCTRGLGAVQLGELQGQQRAVVGHSMAGTWQRRRCRRQAAALEAARNTCRQGVCKCCRAFEEDTLPRPRPPVGPITSPITNSRVRVDGNGQYAVAAGSKILA